MCSRDCAADWGVVVEALVMGSNKLAAAASWVNPAVEGGMLGEAAVTAVASDVPAAGEEPDFKMAGLDFCCAGVPGS